MFTALSVPTERKQTCHLCVTFLLNYIFFFTITHVVTYIYVIIIIIMFMYA
jgi:hypothetical protein